MASMNAVRIQAYGGRDALVYEEAARPIAGEGEVLIRVHATTVNPFDCAVRAGYMSAWYNYSFPLILGLDISGVIEEVGSGVTSFAPGDEVYARADPGRNGAYAEYVVVNAALVAAKPQSLDHLQAAAMPHVSMTAWDAVMNAANLKEGETILIHAAAGGVGHIAVQLAKQRGAHVIGTSSGYNLDFLRQLGADEVIDYTATPFETVVRDVDVVLDLVGGDTLERSWSILKRGGILISTVQPPNQETAASYGVRQHFVFAAQPAGEVLTEVGKLVDAGQIKPVVSATLPIHEIQRAHELSEGRHIRGKLVLQIVDE